MRQADRSEGRAGGGGGDSCLSLSRSLLLPGVSLLMLWPREDFVFGVVGDSGVFTDAASGDVQVAGAAALLVTLCSREDKPTHNKKHLR